MRIEGITIPETKRIEIALTSVFGIGRPLAHRILDAAKIEYGKKPSTLSLEEEQAIRKAIVDLGIVLEGELRRDVGGNIRRLKDIGSYRGSRHAKRLPARGQRTKTNARTLKGERKTATSGKKKVEKK